MHQNFILTHKTQLTINFQWGNVIAKLEGEEQYLLAQSLNIIQVRIVLEPPESGVWL